MVYSALSFATVTVIVVMELASMRALFVEETVMVKDVRPLSFTVTNCTLAVLAMDAKTWIMSCGAQQQRITTKTENGVIVYVDCASATLVIPANHALQQRKPSLDF
jgi:hypothetical protein